MAVKGTAIVYCVAGGLVLYSGIKGATISDTVKAVLAGNLNPAATEPITVDNGASGASGANPGNVASGNASENYLLIANYLVSQGYSKAAAAGICGCIAGESGGNPEILEDPGTPVASNSGGGGLIQWTPISAHPTYITGNANTDLATQMEAIVAYNNGIGASLIAMLNAQTDPVQAADFYSQYFEKPAVANSDVVPSVAASVYKSIQSSSVPTG